MAKSKKFVYDWEDYEDGKKNAETMIADILADGELDSLDELVIGCWGESWENDAQPIIDGIVENKERFSNIKSLFVGDMDYEECEVSWIEQGNYEKLWEALPQLEKLTIKGSTNLSLGKIKHDNLKSLEIICGGLPKEVLASIGEAKLPSLVTLSLYIGVEDYGFDGDIGDITAMLEKSDFANLKSLGILDSEIQDEIAGSVLKCKYMNQISRLDLSYGTLTDEGGQLLLDTLPSFPNIKELDLEHHFMSDEMMNKLSALDAEVNMDDQQEAENYHGEIYRYPMLTE